MDFKGQTVIVTGAAGNLGQAVANAFAARGANLVLIDLKQEALARAFGADSATRLLAPTNLLEQAQVESTVQKALDRFKRIDVLCNIAAYGALGL
jgi:NAD(P)-dependent dehydrogenase (short-subunit alcohol dehydrogenase family)